MCCTMCTCYKDTKKRSVCKGIIHNNERSTSVVIQFKRSVKKRTGQEEVSYLVLFTLNLNVTHND